MIWFLPTLHSHVLPCFSPQEGSLAMQMCYTGPHLDSSSLGSLYTMFFHTCGCHSSNLCTLVWETTFNRPIQEGQLTLCSLSLIHFILPWLFPGWRLAFFSMHSAFLITEPPNKASNPPGFTAPCPVPRAAAGIGSAIVEWRNVGDRSHVPRSRGKNLFVFQIHCFLAHASCFVLHVVFSQPSGPL